MNQINAWLVTAVGILLLLPLIGVDQLGTPTKGTLAWLLAIGVIIIGVTQLIKVYKK